MYNILHGGLMRNGPLTGKIHNTGVLNFMPNRNHMLLASLLLALFAGVFPAFAQDGGTITLGQIVGGEITEQNPRVSYAFSGQAGDIITVSMTATGGGLDSYVELLSPLGNPLNANDDGGGNLNSLLGPYTLPETGAYTIVATRGCGDGAGGSTGSYNLVVNRAEIRTVTMGETISVDLPTAESSVFLQFQSSMNNQPLSLISRIIEGSPGVIIEVRDPAGMSINQLWHNTSVTATLDPLVLSAAGNYMLSVYFDTNMAASPTPTRLELTISPLEVTPLAVGSTVSGTLDDSRPTAYYAFSGTPDDLLRLTGQQNPAGQPFDIAVYNPNGFSISGGGSGYGQGDQVGTVTIDPLQLPVTGQYLLGLRRSDLTGRGVTGTSEYTITLEASQIPSLQSGVEATGSIDINTAQTVYRIAGTAGQTVNIRLRSLNDAYAPNLNMQGPAIPVAESASIGGGGGGGFFITMSGTTPGTATYETTLPVTGVYLVWVYNGAYIPDQVAQFGLTVTIGG
jgi:hypothetical protein